MTRHAVATLMPLMVTVPIVAACILIALEGRLPRRVIDLLAITTTAAVTVLAALLLAHCHGRAVNWIGGWHPAHGLSAGIPLIADPLSAGLALLAAALMTCALLYSWHYFSSAGGRFHALMLLFLAGMAGFALSGDLFDMFVFFELMGAAGYALTGMRIEDKTAVQGGLTFGIINSFGAYLSLTGLVILYSVVGQLGLPQLGTALRHHHPSTLVVASFVLIISGLLVKAGVVPFHFWSADAHAVAPTPVCVLFSGVMSQLGLYGAARVYWIIFSGTIPRADVSRGFIVVGALTAVLGATMCFAQRHLKRLLAYSTIAHIGLFTIGLGALSPDGTGGTALYVAGHAGVKAALFLLVGIMLNRYGNVDEVRLYGCGKQERGLAVLYFLAALGLADLPFFGTSLGRSTIEDAVGAAGYPWAPALFVLVSAVAAGAVLRAGMRVYLGLGPPPEPGPAAAGEETSGAEAERETPALSRTPATMTAAIVILLGGALAAGVLPGAMDAFVAAGHRFTDASGYIGQALFHTQVTALRLPPPVGWTVHGTGLGLLSAALAVCFALLGIYARRLPAAVQAAGRPGVPVMRGLHRLHSGHIGDYIAWLLTGVAGLAALIGLPLL